MYERKRACEFYDTYGAWEWSRLEATPYGRLQATMHNDFIHAYFRPDARVLDVGCGPGRFSRTASLLGGRVVALDLSVRQRELAREKLRSAEVYQQVQGFLRGDLVSFRLEPESFDLVICYGGALSYVCELRHKAAEELFRVTRPGGTLLASVMSRFGTLALIGRRQLVQIMEHPDAWNLSQVAELGDLAQFPSSKVSISQPPMHLYSAGEIKELLASVGFDVLGVAGSTVGAP